MSVVQLKFCGLHHERDVKHASESEADVLGFVFANGKRQVKPEQVQTWFKTYKPENQRVAFLFVNPNVNEVLDIIDTSMVDIIQFHGNESPEFLKHIRSKQPNVDIWKAIHHSEDSFAQLEQYREVVEGFVVDAKAKGAWGGTGKQFDWEAVPSYVKWGRDNDVPLYIAGGVTPDNVEQLLSYQPYGIDVSSGTETDGQKDPKKMATLVEKVKQT